MISQLGHICSSRMGHVLSGHPNPNPNPSPSPSPSPNPNRNPSPRILKARFCKHAKDLVAASEWMEQARGLDLADRYLNTKSTRYLVRVMGLGLGLGLANPNPNANPITLTR